MSTFSGEDHTASNLEIFSSAPATLLYLHGAGTEKRRMIPRTFLERLWKGNTDRDIIPADNFLPFDPNLGLTSQEFFSELPPSVPIEKRSVRIGVPWTYLSEAFYAFIKKTAAECGINAQIVKLNQKEWFDALDGSPTEQIDYVLGVYAASERYPAVQLRYIAGTARGPDVDLKQAETPDLDSEKREILKSFQKALIHEGFAIPLFFSKHQITYRKGIDVGDQPPSDAELEMWRIEKK